MIPIKSFLGLTLIDWPGKIASLIYLGGCNFRCPFCYNVDLVKNPEKIPNIKEKEILEKLEERKNFIEGVVLTGGEPTLTLNLGDFLKRIKKIGLKIALETNGSRPEVLKDLMKKNLIEGVFMDIKGPLEKYEKIAKVKIDKEKIKKSVNLIFENFPKIEGEFRTTIVPTLLDKEDIEKIGQWLKGDVPYALQQFQNKKTLDSKFQKIKPYEKKDLEGIVKIASKYFKKVELRGI